jgi:23S rRNA pseudouridine1911/1915/1917 synthase
MDTSRYCGTEAPLITPAQVLEWIIEDTPDYVVFNKPGWVVCHPSKQGPWSSLVGAFRELRGLDKIHLVSRLDRETSGVVVIALNHATASRLQTAFAARRTKKTYVALLHGHLKEARTTESLLEPDPDSPVFVKQRVAFAGRGKSATTHFEPIETWGAWTLARIIPESGRKHQIRAHAEWLGHPIVGDKIYGGDPLCYLDFIDHGWDASLAARLQLPRQALHAASLEIHGPGWHLDFSAPCPFTDEGFKSVADASLLD